MSGDITSINGTTQLLMREISRVTAAVLALPSVDGRVALLGHSMASDIIVRCAITDPRIMGDRRDLDVSQRRSRPRNREISL